MHLALALLASAAAATLPGVPLPFDVDAGGRWVLPAALPAAFVQAGVAPGWALTGVDGQAFSPDKTSRQVAAGPGRMVQLEFQTPQGETVLVVPRADLVQVEELGLLAFPAEVAAPVGPLERAADGTLWVRDAAQATFRFDPASGALSRGAPVGPTAAAAPPPVFWALTDAPYVLLPDPAVRPGPVSPTPAAEVAAALAGAARLSSFQGKPGEHLLVPTAEGLSVWALSFPRGTPALPTCTPAVPESCFVAGQAVATELAARPGGAAEAQRLFDAACDGGVYRGCVSSFVLGQPSLAGRAEACVAQDANACHALARAALDGVDGPPDARTTGVLEVACAVDASGSLGERLRRLEDVGEGCMLLSRAFDARAIPDRALLSLDQACLLGRADACTEATRRRADAFALRTVRECEDPSLPLASACVQLGRLLQAGPIAATKLDDFAAFQRACGLGDEDGCVLLGDYVDRWGIAHPRVVAAEADLRAACTSGEQRACVGAGHLLVRHEPRSPAYGEALSLFAGACAAGLPSGCIAGAEQRRIGAARKVDAPAPTSLWSSACDQASAPGCAGLGERLARERDTWDAAYTAWTRACDTGEAAACTDLGQFVTRKHEPVWPGEQPFDAYLRRGCDGGDAEGCFHLGAAGLPRKGDPPEPAYLLLERSCEGDYGTACAALGRVHLQRKTSFDDEIAARHLESACDNGHFESCKQLGEMYARGKGVEKDRVRAKEFAQRYSVNATRKHVRVGVQLGFPYVAGGTAELVVPVPVGPALALTGSYSYLPKLGGVMVQLEGDSYPDDAPDLTWVDAGLRLYPNTKARGLFVMAGAHRLQASGGVLAGGAPVTRQGFSARLGIHNDARWSYTRVEMGIGQYGMVNLNDFDEDETGTFPLVQATLGFSVGLAPF
jgi:TPR repeat protein